MSLRYAGTCSVCHTPLAAHTKAWWDSEASKVTCLACTPAVAPETTAEATEALHGRAHAALDPGIPGGSTTREHQRRHDKREASIHAAHPRLGGVILALTSEPNSISAWSKGAEGERMVAARLASLVNQGVLSLHDRRIPGSKANIDHIAVGPAGVFVIDAKRYSGQVTRQATGTVWRPGPDRLFVGKRNCTKLIDGMAHQVAAVERALIGLDPAPPVTPMLCFIDTEWGLFSKPFILDGVWIGWGKAMAEVVSKSGPFTAEQVTLTAAALAERLPPA